jgi:hypothetical protein
LFNFVNPGAFMHNVAKLLFPQLFLGFVSVVYGQSCYFSYYSVTSKIVIEFLTNPLEDPITDIRTATPLTLQQSYTVSACIPPATPEVWTWIAIHSSTQYTATATHTYSGAATVYTVTHTFTGLLLNQLKTLDVIGLVWLSKAPL